MADEIIQGASSTAGAGGGDTVAGGASTVSGGASTTAGAGGDTVGGAAAGGTIATGNAPDPKGTAPQTFPDDWRQKLAGDDKKELARLERFGSPGDLFKAYREIENKLNSGTLKQVAAFPKEGTAEQQAEWRKSNAIPDSADKYDLTLPDGLVLGETDKPLVEGFTKFAHDRNWNNQQVKDGLEWYSKLQQEQLAQAEESHNEFKVQSVELLKDEWGADYKPNLNGIRGLLNTLPQDDVNRLLSGTTADGRVVGDDPGVLKILNMLAREVNPAGSVVPTSTNAPADIASELASMQKLMGDTNSEYWKGAKAEGMQQRYRDLLTAQERIKGKAV